MENPFESPQVEAPSRQSTDGIFTPGQAAGLGCLAGPFAALIAVTMNHLKFGQRDAGLRVLLLGSTAITLFLLVAMRLPSALTRPAAFAFAYSAWVYVTRVQGASVRSHLDGGGGSQPWWVVLSVGAGGFAMIVAVALIAIASAPG